MKRIFSLAIMAITFATSCFSQNISGLTNEIYASYGFFPVGHTASPDLSEGNNSYGAKFSYRLTNEKKSGTLNIGYLHKISNKVSLGLSYTYSTVSGEVHMGTSIALANSEIKNHIVLINTKFSWVQKSKFSVYSRLGLGVKFSSKAKFTDINSLFTPQKQDGIKRIAWQASIIGAEWHFTNNLSLFAEGGAGLQGCILTGAKLHF